MADLFHTIEQQLYRSEAQAVDDLLSQWHALNLDEVGIDAQARTWIQTLRATPQQKLSIEAFFAHYPLSSTEGLSLMALAEAALRIPDTDNLDQLIIEKVVEQNWQQTNQKSNWLIKMATLGLHASQTIGPKFKWSAPLLRQGIKQAMKWLGEHFIMGKNIERAIKRSLKQHRYTHSFDMLGEAALTEHDALDYFQSYMHAIETLAGNRSDQPLLKRAGISIKLSALYPRYEWKQQQRCVDVLSERLLALAVAAKQAGIPLTIDAEESYRLVLSLQIFERVYLDASLAGWDGLGLAIQAYLKATLTVIDWLTHLHQKGGRRIPVRLVKGAYWDSEIKEAQVKGIAHYPVWTQKATTDVHYTLCAHKLLAHSEAFLVQFATHNALTLATLLTMIPANSDAELQCLHGMGDALYQCVLKTYPERLCRIYAPVGQHATLLPYLVRRLLENGASASFVNQVLHPSIPIDQLTQSPGKRMAQQPKCHPRIPLPPDLFGQSRRNACALLMDTQQTWVELEQALQTALANFPSSQPNLAHGPSHSQHTLPITNPAQSQYPLGTQQLSQADDVAHAIDQARLAHRGWQHRPIEQRCAMLEQAADALEHAFTHFASLCVLEAGKSWHDAHDEVREAIDFLRYYAHMARTTLERIELPGPTGESNQWIPQGRGVFLCISPWNFPLAIFTGQVAAALVAGNCVLAKPATQTTAVAHAMIELLHQAGIPKAVLQGVPGSRTVIAKVLQHPHLSGVMLTGSTQSAKTIAKTLAEREGAIIPLIAETGGQNCMIVDSTAHPEQAVLDIVHSAFQSAGQRCSALRVLFLQDEIADKMLSMIQGAMAMLVIGDPRAQNVDVGPVIDAPAKDSLIAHIEAMQQAQQTILYQCPLPQDLGSELYVPPTLIALDGIERLQEEVFGPILHVVRYQQHDLDAVIDSINQTGYGLTLGIHSRLQATCDAICEQAEVGNIYINRNMIGAVVGVQPFGGKKCSGTGPKAGGPWYLLQLCEEMTLTNNTAAVGGNAALMSLDAS